MLALFVSSLRRSAGSQPCVHKAPTADAQGRGCGADEVVSTGAKTTRSVHHKIEPAQEGRTALSHCYRWKKSKLTFPCGPTLRTDSVVAGRRSQPEGLLPPSEMPGVEVERHATGFQRRCVDLWASACCRLGSGTMCSAVRSVDAFMHEREHLQTGVIQATQRHCGW